VVKVTGVAVSPDAVTLHFSPCGATTGKLTATVFPSDAANKSVTWESSVPALVTVDNAGNISTVGKFGDGTAIIKATTADGGFVSSSTVTVVPCLPKAVYRNKAEHSD
jgi:uncharacterized protein YjdB